LGRADKFGVAARLRILVFPMNEHHSSLGAKGREVNCRHTCVTGGRAPEVPCSREFLIRPLG
jgi:hypothetical protein